MQINWWQSAPVYKKQFIFNRDVLLTKARKGKLLHLPRVRTEEAKKVYLLF